MYAEDEIIKCTSRCTGERCWSVAVKSLSIFAAWLGRILQKIKAHGKNVSVYPASYL